MAHQIEPLDKSDYRIPHLNPYNKIVTRMAFITPFMLIPQIFLLVFLGVIGIAFGNPIYWVVICLTPIFALFSGSGMGYGVGYVLGRSTNTPKRLNHIGKSNIMLVASTTSLIFLFADSNHRYYEWVGWRILGEFSYSISFVDLYCCVFYGQENR